MMNGWKWAGALVALGVVVAGQPAYAQSSAGIPTPLRIFESVYLPSDTTGGRTAVLSKPISVPGGFKGGTAEFWFAYPDTLAADSGAVEIFTLASTRDTAATARLDLDNSNGRLDGIFVSGQSDTTELAKTINLTPLAIEGVKWPWRVSSWQVFSRADHAAAGMNLLDVGTPHIVKVIVQLADGFGGELNVKNLRFLVVNRHPRIWVMAIDGWYLAAK